MSALKIQRANTYSFSRYTLCKPFTREKCADRRRSWVDPVCFLKTTLFSFKEEEHCKKSKSKHLVFSRYSLCRSFTSVWVFFLICFVKTVPALKAKSILKNQGATTFSFSRYRLWTSFMRAK